MAVQGRTDQRRPSFERYYWTTESQCNLNTYLQRTEHRSCRYSYLLCRSSKEYLLSMRDILEQSIQHSLVPSVASFYSH